jgi:hypothetical protein
MSEVICPTCRKPITDKDAVMHHNCLPPQMTAANQPKPREWWILPDGQTLDFPAQHFRSIHVIEKSAYDQVLADAKALAEALEVIAHYSNNHGPDLTRTAQKALTPSIREKYL